jgi:hypothetical protein
MNAVAIPNRPFSTEIITGLLLPDGLFEALLGKQRINAHFKNTDAAAANGLQIYIESVSHPGIVVTPVTHHVSQLAGGAARALSWEADFSAAPAGVHYVSFVVQDAGGKRRVIKKIFVTRTHFDAATKTFHSETPEGMLSVRFSDLIGPKDQCCGKKRNPTENNQHDRDLGSMINALGKLFQGHDPDFIACLPGYLPSSLDLVVTPTPPFPGQYGDLPFEDPWWKVILCLIAVLLLIGAAIAGAVSGGGSVTVSGGGGGGTGGTGTGSCCGVTASGGGSSYVVAGLVAAAAAAATAAGLSDIRDPMRRGQDNTLPLPGELTTAEKLHVDLSYPEPVALGRPFAVEADWKYTRVTTGNTYTFAAQDTTQNVHVLSSYKIQAPDVVYRYQGGSFVVRAQFFDKEGEQLRGEQLFVQCLLVGPNGEFNRFLLQDDGLSPDDKPSDGTYTGAFSFRSEKQATGLWLYYVIAQDINNAQPDMKPEEAAQIIGGMVVTHQLTIDFTGGECPFVPDGHVNVIG